ncbi:MAG: cation:proton antiporter [Nannocystaceae bacterium]
MHDVLVISAMLLLSVLLGAGLARLGLPRIAAYVGVGVLFSPDVLGGRLGFACDDWSDLATALALGMIAFLIGGSLKVQSLRRLGPLVLLGTLGEAFGAVIAVFLGFWFTFPDGPVSATSVALALGAVAATTDPAATVAVIHQYRARGPSSETLLGIAGLDDAVGVMIFAGVAAVLSGGGLGAAAIEASREIFGAVALGAAAGLALGRHGNRVDGELTLPLVLSSVLLILAAASALGVSPILAAMAFGFAARATCKTDDDRLFGPLERGEEVIFLGFFVIAGTHFRVQIFVDNLQWIAAYVLLRALGKIVGVALGARLGGATPAQARWLGLGLVPQAGVAIGLALTLAQIPALAPIGPTLVNVVLGAAILYELIGPFTARLALARLGELGDPRSPR